MPSPQRPFPPVGSFAWAHSVLEQQRKLSAHQIVVLIRSSFTAKQVRQITKFLMVQRKRGRKPQRTPAQLDFNDAFQEMLREIDKRGGEFRKARAQRRAEAKLSGEILAKAQNAPAEDMWDDLVRRYGRRLKINGRDNLRNIVSHYRNPRWEPPDHPPEFEEVEANWRSQQSASKFRAGSGRSDRVQPHAKARKDAK